MKRDASKRLPPGPKGLPLLGNLLERRRRPLEVYENAARQYGDIVSIPMAHLRIVLLTHPRHVKLILQDCTENYRKGSPYAGLRRFLGNGLLTSEGENWRIQRRRVQPPFHRAAVLGTAGLIDRCIGECLEEWRPGPAGHVDADLYVSMMRLTLEVAARALFGSTLSSPDKLALSDSLKILIHQANEDALTLLKPPAWLPTPRKTRVKKALERLDGIIFRSIAERMKPGAEKHDDFLGRLIEVRDEETPKGMSSRMSERQLRDEIVSFFIAGHETTATALSWILYLVASHPEPRQKLREELREFRARVAAGQAALEDSLALPYTTAVIKEGLRLYPPGWILPRQAVNDDVIDGYDIPAGSIAVICPYVMHRHPGYWRDPLKFDPGRFLGPEDPDKYVYLPFSVGPRSCIGSTLAMLEMALALLKIVPDFEIQIAPGQVNVPEPVITLRPKGGIRARITPISNS